MSSLSADIRRLEEDLTASPTRISAYHDLPFAILRYDAEEEWDLRREARRLAVRLNNSGKRVHTISLADLLWEAMEDCEGLDAVVELESVDWSLPDEQLKERISKRAAWC